jgi:hypothetical protein
MSTTPTVTIDMSKECVECGKLAAADNGLCLKCFSAAALGVREMKSSEGKAVASKLQENREKRKTT